MVAYHLVYTRFMFQSPIEHQNTHLLFGLMIVYATILVKRKKHWPLILPFIAASLFACGYIFYFYEELELRIGLPTQFDIYIGIILLVVTFVAAFNAIGRVLPIVGLIFIAYTFFGNYLPDPLWHFPISLDCAISMYNIGFSGMFGMVLGVSANYIFLFIMFGAFLSASGASQFFIEMGKLVSRRLAGGAGMTAVISSALVGMVTGTGAANVAITGPFTIPLMKSVGYKAEQAGGIETVASAGGNIMPPIMGIVAFIMAEYLAVPYIVVCAMAIIPAILYYLCIGLFVQLNALKMGLKPISTEVDYRVIRQRAPLFFIPLIVMIVLLAMGYSLILVSFASNVLLLLLAVLRKETRGTFATWLDACVKGTWVGASIAVTCGIVGVIVSSMGLTGLGLRFPVIVEALSGGSLPIALLLAAVMMITLGCGADPLSCYMIGAILVVPALTGMGVSLFPAHFFMFYFAVFALITPPVALTAVVAAPIAGAGYIKTCFQAVRAALVAWLLPFMIVWAPGLILQPQDIISMVTKLTASFAMVIFLQVAVVGYYFTRLNLAMRGISLICVAALVAFIFTGNFILLAVGLIVGILLTLWQLRVSRTLKGATAR